MLLQSQALTTLVGQIAAGNSDPLSNLQAGSTLTTKGIQGADEVTSGAGTRRMDAAGGSPLPATWSTTGASAHRRSELAAAADLLASNKVEHAKDVLGLLVMIEQMSLDGGRAELGWILCLQPDPPSIFQDHQALPTTNLRPFANLADTKWISAPIREGAGHAVLEQTRVCQAETGPSSVPAPPRRLQRSRALDAAPCSFDDRGARPVPASLDS